MTATTSHPLLSCFPLWSFWIMTGITASTGTGRGAS